MERVLWILQVGPIQSPESLKQVTFLTGGGEGQRDCCMRQFLPCSVAALRCRSPRARARAASQPVGTQRAQSYDSMELNSANSCMSKKVSSPLQLVERNTACQHFSLVRLIPDLRPTGQGNTFALNHEGCDNCHSSARKLIQITMEFQAASGGVAP